ncbi:MAG: hypothetical protein WB580_13060, partial [Candidatus Binataceae bacterium]
QPMHCIGDNHGAGFRDRLHSRGNIGRIAEYVGVFARTCAHHHRAGIDTDPRQELWVGGVLVKLRYGVEHRQAGAGSTLRVVVVGLGIAEVRHYTVTKVLRDTPAKALDGLRCRTMVLADDLAPLFGIEMASYLSRADKIAEQYRQMPPLAG